MKLWNELNFETQSKVLDLIKELVYSEREYDTQEGLIAAIAELKMWINTPIINEEYVAEAQDPPESDY